MNTYKKSLLLAIALGSNILLSAGTFVSYENPKSVKLKTQYAMGMPIADGKDGKKGTVQLKDKLAGIMVCDASGEWFNDKGTPALTTAIINELKNKGGEFTIYFPNFTSPAYSKNNLEQIIKTCVDNKVNITILYGFANPDTNPGDGKASLDADLKSSVHLSTLKNLKTTYPKGVKILLSIGGWNNKERFEKIGAKDNTYNPQLSLAQNNPHLNSLAQSCVKLLSEKFSDIDNVFDGIDIVWQFDGSTPRKKYETFMQLISDEIKRINQNSTPPKKYVLTTALQAGADFYTGKNKIDVAKIANLVDKIWIMSFDYNGPGYSAQTGHNAPLTGSAGQQCVQTSVEGFLNAGAPANKLYLGIAYYGHSYSNVANKDLKHPGLNQSFKGAPSSGFLGSSGVGTMYYCNLPGNALSSDTKGKNGFEYYWDDTCQVPYLFNPGSKPAEKKPLSQAKKPKK